MSKKGSKLTDLPTACRFAVLEVSDDSEDEEKQITNAKETNDPKKTNDSTSASSKKKKQKKRKPKSKTSQVDGLEEIELPNNQSKPNIAITKDDWVTWQSRDEKFVLEQFQKDLQAALEASKATNVSKTQPENDLSSSKKKKKDKTVSLDEFISGNNDTKNQVQANGNISKFEGDSGLYALDDFQEEKTIEPVQDEKPQKTRRKKKNHEKHVEEETAKKDSEHKEHKVISISNEESIKAEMVHVQDELRKQEEIVNEQRMTIEKQKDWIGDLQKELVQVKKRNKQLCHILGQGEMKEKAELLLQIEELNEVREQVVQLHAELEQERSKSSALKQELAKHQMSHGRTRHGSTS